MSSPLIPPSGSLHGLSILVTGSIGSPAGQIGRTARERGARVALAMPRSSDLPPDLEALLTIDASVASEADAEAVAEAALAGLPRLDALIAVVEAAPAPPLHEMTLHAWRRTVTDPLQQAFWLARRTVHEFLAAANGAGRIVFVVTASPSPQPADAAAILETAFVSFARSLAKEYGRRGMTCNVVAGNCGTEPANVTHIVETALFLVSAPASFITGQALEITGNTPTSA